jgi:negative regulator of flagellin synthesis FlgM
MKVSETNVNFGRQAYVQGTEATQPLQGQTGVSQKGPGNDVPEDKVSLSSNAKDMQIAKDALAQVPDVRSEKVEEVRSAVQSGTYEVNAPKIADKMVGATIDEMV